MEMMVQRLVFILSRHLCLVRPNEVTWKHYKYLGSYSLNAPGNQVSAGPPVGQ